MKNILVTGAAGYIGSKVAYDLIDSGFNVISIDNLSNGYKKLVPKRSIFFKKDLTNFKGLEKIFKKYHFDAIYHFAAKKKVDESQKFPLKYFNSNVIGTKNLLDLSIKYKVHNFIFSSTCAVYGNTLKTKVSEKEPCLPESYYGYTKLISENTIVEYKKKYNFNYAILRYFNVVGADYKLRTGEIKQGSLFKSICNSIKTKRKFSIYGTNYKTQDGTCIRDYIDINDLSNLHLIAHEYINKNKKSILFNCGYNMPVSVLNVIKNFEIILKNKIQKIAICRRAGDIEKIFSDNKLQRKLFPKFKKNFNLKNSIKNTLEWEKIID